MRYTDAQLEEITRRTTAHSSDNAAVVLPLVYDLQDSRRALACYKWRPISQLHEDFGPCVLINLIEDPSHIEIGSNLNSDFDESEWTHFAEVPKLTSNDAEELLANMAERAHELSLGDAWEGGFAANH